jgi:hypothetical protein
MAYWIMKMDEWFAEWENIDWDGNPTDWPLGAAPHTIPLLSPEGKRLDVVDGFKRRNFDDFVKTKKRLSTGFGLTEEELALVDTHYLVKFLEEEVAQGRKGGTIDGKQVAGHRILKGGRRRPD